MYMYRYMYEGPLVFVSFFLCPVHVQHTSCIVTAMKRGVKRIYIYIYMGIGICINGL